MAHGLRRRAFGALLVVSLAGCASPSASVGSTDGTRPPASASAPEATSASAGSVWVADEGGDSLTVLDGGTGEVTATLTGLGAPHNVQASADGTTVWAVSGDDLVVALDAASLEVTALGMTDEHPAHVVGDDEGGVYVTSSGQPSFYAYDERLRPVSRTALAGSPHGMRLSADGRRAVVANTGSGSVDVLQDGALVRSVPVGPDPVQVAVSDDGTVAFVSLAGSSEVARVDLEAGTVTHRVEVPSAPAQVLLTAGGLLLSADQGTAQAPGSTVTVVDAATMTVRGQVAVGLGPHGLTSDPQGLRAWVTNSFEDTVSEIDLTTLSVVRTVAVGDQPGGISFSPGAATRTGDVALDLQGREDRGEGHSHDH